MEALGRMVCLLLTTLVIAGSMTACAPDRRHRLLSTVFDGVPQPGQESPEGEPTPAVSAAREPGSVPAPAPATEPTELGPPVQRWDSYADLAAALPSDAVGNVDWVEAIRRGELKPRAGIAPDAPDMPVFPLDIHRDPGIPGLEVVFPHGAHTQWLSCENCHPAIFEMRANANPISMAKIFEGEYCGRCHGKVAFDPATGCSRCHVKFGAPS